MVRETSEWLAKLGMSEYAQRFAENDIDFAVLGDLTDQDLKELGVASLGHRRKLLRAIVEARSAKTEVSKSGAAGTTVIESPQDTAERRQVTVIFCDLVGSTTLSTRMDPEDLREIISAYQKCAADTVRRFGGFVAKYMGDGVIVYIGYPQAHEDDAERAVRAGLELVAAVANLKGPASLQTRIGIATGLVVVGDLIGSGEAQERGIVGETPNLSARLQGIAAPNMVVIAEGTRKLIGNLFELEDLGARDLKGIAGPVRAFAALRARSVESRFEALHASGLTAMVGREEELELLRRRWSKAKTGEGQVILISGEAGIGKSRLTAAVLEAITAEPHTRLRYFCSPQHTDSTLHPIIGQLERAAGLLHDDAPVVKLDKLDAVLAQTATSKEDAAFFADMLSLTNDGRYLVLDLSPQQRRQKTLDALGTRLAALAQRHPVLMIFEDAHWSDPTSLEALGRTVDRIKNLRVLLIVTYRPEFAPPWIGEPHVTSLTLNRLAERNIAAMIERVAGNKPLSAALRQEIIERTDGIPLFAEEMTKAVIEAESESEARRTVAAVPSSSVPVPSSLQAPLLARLDRLGPAKELAQIGAAIGREFSHSLLAAVAHKREDELHSALDQLIQSGLLFRQGLPPHATYLFKHALVQDAAYGTLLREPRTVLHARIAKTIESQFAEIADAQPETLARHFAQAGIAEDAIGYYLKAAELALARSATAEAITHLQTGLGRLGSIADEVSRCRREIDLQLLLAQAIIAASGFAAVEVGEALGRAQFQCEALGDSARLFATLATQWLHALVRGEHESGLHAARRLLTMAGSEKDGSTVGKLVVGEVTTGVSLLALGSPAEARLHFERAITVSDRRAADAYMFSLGFAANVAALAWLAVSFIYLGFLDRGNECCRQAVAMARELGHPFTLAFAYSMGAKCLSWLGDDRTESEWIDAAVGIAEDRGFPFYKATSLLLRGSLLANGGSPDQGLALAAEGLRAFRAAGQKYQVAWAVECYADACEAARQPALGLSTLGDTLEQMHNSGERECESEMFRRRGRLLLLQQEQVRAEESYQIALRLARRDLAKLWELRAAMDLALLWRDKGKPDEAHKLLAPVYNWFTEGFDTLDLKGAKALLGELG